MRGYFSYFPKLIYTFDKDTVNKQAVTNIFARSSFLKEVANNTSAYFRYQVKEDDTAEIIADKIYGDSYRAWIILLFNNVINPNYDFPMKPDVLDDYIEKKYNQTITESKDDIHHYEKLTIKTLTKGGITLGENVERHIITQNTYNFVTNSIAPEILPTISDTLVTVSTEVVLLTGGITLTIVIKNKSVSNYTYEFEENEKRRTIKLLDPAYVQRVEQEFSQIMKNG